MCFFIRKKVFPINGYKFFTLFFQQTKSPEMLKIQQIIKISQIKLCFYLFFSYFCQHLHADNV